MRHINPITAILSAMLWLAACSLAAAPPEVDNAYSFDDYPLEDPLVYPDWFKKSFLDIGEDLAEAVDAGKQGLMVYFGQKRCAYCHKLINDNFGLSDIAEYTRRHFDVVPIDIWGVDEVTNLAGDVLTERDYALAEDTNFTPSIIFLDAEGKQALRLRGYYPPYQFRAALEYVAGGHYVKESFRDYLARGENRMVFEADDLNEEDFFSPPPFNLDRSRLTSEHPLAVFFEQGDCHACDILHGQVLRERAISQHFDVLDSVQLDMWSGKPVITPGGKRTTARQWAADLGLFYAPSVIFFDESGQEILRVASVVRIYRLRNVLSYISSKDYLTEPSYQKWRVKQIERRL